jgi:hypothetical protein
MFVKLTVPTLTEKEAAVLVATAKHYGLMVDLVDFGGAAPGCLIVEGRAVVISERAAAANWAAVLAEVLAEIGYAWTLPTGKSLPRVRIGQTIRIVWPPAGWVAGAYDPFALGRLAREFGAK